MAPTSQKAGQRPISFLLTDSFSGVNTSINLVIRPEDLTRNEPSRASVSQTLEGAWVDNFGPGISSIQIAGHTGWRGGYTTDGVAAFSELRSGVFAEWHRLRAQAKDAGQDPNSVKLIFADVLDSIAVVVVPMNFLLKRNRSRPLLMMYQIGMTVVEELDQSILKSASLSPTDVSAAGIDSLADCLDRINSYAAQVQSFIDANVAGPIHQFMNLTNTAFSKVLQVVGTAESIVDSQANQLIGIASDIALVGRNAFYTYNAVVGLPSRIQFAVAQVAASYENAFCVLKNAFKRQRQYEDYSDLYGASTCSSTAGGSPLSPLRGGNAFEQIMGASSAPVSVTTDARTNINWLKATDPVLAPMSIADMSSRLASINSGVVFA